MGVVARVLCCCQQVIVEWAVVISQGTVVSKLLLSGLLLFPGHCCQQVIVEWAVVVSRALLSASYC